MSDLIELRNDIAASLFLLPCKEEELFERDFLKNKSQYGIQLFIRRLEQLDALYYKGDVMHHNGRKYKTLQQKDNKCNKSKLFTYK